jgi:hypothetical protein
VALAVNWFTTATNITTSVQVPYTVPSTGYNRDLVIANGGTTPVFISFGPAVTSAITTSSFEIPSGQQVVVMGQAPTSAVMYAVAGTSLTVSTMSLGWASVVSVI